MQALTLRIPGRYWDSQIYAGTLYLFSRDHDLFLLDWRKTIDSLQSANEKLRTALDIGFLNGELLYNNQVQRLLLDPAIRSVIIDQLTQAGTLKNLEIEVDSSKKLANPFPAPHADSEIYYQRLYVGLKTGCFSTAFRHLDSDKSGGRPQKHWDGPVYSVKASPHYTALALASAEEGLREFSVETEDHTPKEQAPRQIAKRACTACAWAYQSIFAWTYSGAGFLAAFRKEEDKRTRRTERVFDRVIDSNKIFSRGTLAWGAQDKMYTLVDGELDMAKYDPKVELSEVDDPTKTKKAAFVRTGTEKVPFAQQAVVSAGTADFATIVETDNSLVVLRSDEATETLNSEPVSWRIFPRSDNYTNQLHIIYDDFLEVRAYVHDFFVDQRGKRYGIARR